MQSKRTSCRDRGRKVYPTIRVRLDHGGNAWFQEVLVRASYVAICTVGPSRAALHEEKLADPTQATRSTRCGGFERRVRLVMRWRASVLVLGGAVGKSPSSYVEPHAACQRDLMRRALLTYSSNNWLK